MMNKKNAKPIAKIIKLATLLALVVLLAFYFGKKPTLHANWKTQYQLQPTVTLKKDTIVIQNYRDFRYAANGEIRNANYITKEYSLSELKQVWLGLSHFGRFGLAHAFASFEFSDGEFMVVSLEARLQKSHHHYNPFLGLFRHYTKTMIIGSEQDIVGLRSHIRKERLYLYRLTGSELQAKALLLNFLRQAQFLNEEAEFYNTVSDNCLTGLLKESKQYRDWYDWIDYRILLPGYADRLLFENGNIASTVDFKATQTFSRVNPESTDIEAADFSTKIRYSQ